MTLKLLLLTIVAGITLSLSGCVVYDRDHGAYYRDHDHHYQNRDYGRRHDDYHDRYQR